MGSRTRMAPLSTWMALTVSAATFLTAVCVSGVVAPVAQAAGLETGQPPQEVQPVQTARAVHPQDAPEVEYYDVPLSRELQDAAFQAADEWDVPAGLLLAIMGQESGYQVDAVSGTGDYGLMQINAINHPRLREELGITDFLDPVQSIQAGAYMVGELMDKYEDLDRVLTSYNRGETGARNYAEETGSYRSSYSASVLEIYEALEGGDEGAA